MNGLTKMVKEFFKKKDREFERGQYIYNVETGRVGLVMWFNKESRKMRLQLRHNVECECGGEEINLFRPYFGMEDPKKNGGYEDGYIDTIYESRNQCDKFAFKELE